jgi:hypothetical protein
MKAPVVVAGRKSDQDRKEIAEKHAKLRKNLGSSILAADCLPSLARLFDFANDEVAERAPSHQGLEDAAREVLHCAHLKLRELESADPLEPGLALSLHSTLWAARRALNELYGRPGDVKTIELEASGQQPRAICVGASIRVHLWTGEAPSTHAFGCFRVFSDTVQTQRHMWRFWCDEHKPSKAQRPRAWEREMLRRYSAFYLRES